MKKKISLLIIFLIIPLTSSEVIISEIMYNPSGQDTYLEYIEIFNSGNSTINLNNYTLCGSFLKKGYINKQDRELYRNNSFNLERGEHGIITDGGSGTEVYTFFNITNNTLSFHVVSSSLCGGLTNSGKTLTFNGNNFSYNSENGGNGDGKSLNFFNGSFLSGKPNPGFCFIPEVNNTKINNSFKDTINESEPINETEELKCEIGIDIYSDKILECGEHYNYYLSLSSNKEENDALVEYSIEDLFGNYIRNPRETEIDSNENKSRSFTPPEIIGSIPYIIKARILEYECDHNESNNEAEFLISVRGEEKQTEENKTNKTLNKEITLNFLEFPNEIKQGERLSIKVRLNNPFNKSLEGKIYSYVYLNHELANEGGWNPNTEEFQVEKERILTLENIIKEDCKSGFWHLKVKAVTDNEEFEIKDEIKIIRSENKIEEVNMENTQKDDSQEIKEKVYVSETNNTVEMSKYLLLIMIVVIFSLVLVEYRRDNFLKTNIFSQINGRSRNKSENKRRSTKD